MVDEKKERERGYKCPSFDLTLFIVYIFQIPAVKGLFCGNISFYKMLNPFPNVLNYERLWKKYLFFPILFRGFCRNSHLIQLKFATESPQSQELIVYSKGRQ